MLTTPFKAWTENRSIVLVLAFRLLEKERLEVVEVVVHIITAVIAIHVAVIMILQELVAVTHHRMTIAVIIVEIVIHVRGQEVLSNGINVNIDPNLALHRHDHVEIVHRQEIDHHINNQPTPSTDIMTTAIVLNDSIFGNLYTKHNEYRHDY